MSKIAEQIIFWTEFPTYQNSHNTIKRKFLELPIYTE